MSDFEELGMLVAKQALIKTTMRKMEKELGSKAMFHLTYLAAERRRAEIQSVKIKCLNKCKKAILKSKGFGVEKEVYEKQLDLRLPMKNNQGE